MACSASTLCCDTECILKSEFHSRCVICVRRQDSSVGIVTRLQAGCLKSRGLTHGRDKTFSLLQRVWISSGDFPWGNMVRARSQLLTLLQGWE
jgi:hypothetical protein